MDPKKLSNYTIAWEMLRQLRKDERARRYRGGFIEQWSGTDILGDPMNALTMLHGEYLVEMNTANASVKILPAGILAEKNFNSFQQYLKSKSKWTSQQLWTLVVAICGVLTAAVFGGINACNGSKNNTEVQQLKKDVQQLKSSIDTTRK
jgi:hypothetical protein